jgi:uncharacterized protein (DUF4415 family)
MKISKRIVDDPDAPEWTAEKFARSVPFSGLPLEMQRALIPHGRGPQKTPTKVSVTMRLSPDVVESLRASGRGWQTRVDAALRAWVKRQAKKANAA